MELYVYTPPLKTRPNNIKKEMLRGNFRWRLTESRKFFNSPSCSEVTDRIFYHVISGDAYLNLALEYPHESEAKQLTLQTALEEFSSVLHSLNGICTQSIEVIIAYIKWLQGWDTYAEELLTNLKIKLSGVESPLLEEIKELLKLFSKEIPISDRSTPILKFMDLS